MSKTGRATWMCVNCQRANAHPTWHVVMWLAGYLDTRIRQKNIKAANYLNKQGRRQAKTKWETVVLHTSKLAPNEKHSYDCTTPLLCIMWTNWDGITWQCNVLKQAGVWEPGIWFQLPALSKYELEDLKYLWAAASTSEKLGQHHLPS